MMHKGTRLHVRSPAHPFSHPPKLLVPQTIELRLPIAAALTALTRSQVGLTCSIEKHLTVHVRSLYSYLPDQQAMNWQRVGEKTHTCAHAHAHTHTYLHTRTAKPRSTACAKQRSLNAENAMRKVCFCFAGLLYLLLAGCGSWRVPCRPQWPWMAWSLVRAG